MAVRERTWRTTAGGWNQGRPEQGGNGRPDNRGEGRLGGDNVAVRDMAAEESENDAAFTPELTKTSKDSKRERDREKKEQKKDFDKSECRS